MHDCLKENLDTARSVVKNEVIGFMALAEKLGLHADQSESFVYATGREDTSVGISAEVSHTGKLLGIAKTLNRPKS